MTDWTPHIAGSGRPRYLAIAEAIAADIRSGALLPGDRLPPQRRLAERLGIDFTTVSTAIHGECGGYMVLGDGLTDAGGHRHAMAGLLRLETSFAARRLHLGYRSLAAARGPFAGHWAGHEFHYATTVSAAGAPLFAAADAEGTVLPPMGLCAGSVTGSFAHVIAPLPQGVPKVNAPV